MFIYVCLQLRYTRVKQIQLVCLFFGSPLVKPGVQLCISGVRLPCALPLGRRQLCLLPVPCRSRALLSLGSRVWGKPSGFPPFPSWAWLRAPSLS